ncbi:hypothetical protein [Altererythrobacter lauratis]|uniref:DUF4375 domain-containing protein n=1 Tax=Alteraurantiacibacter lauratis TaxID=2054627 RepID=A0ABV7EH61_9SPHN
MTMHFADLARTAASDGTIGDAEVQALRAAGWADGRICRAEAEAILAANAAIADPSPAWSDFFVEALRNFVLNGTPPCGYASAEEAAWLIAMVSADGRVSSLTELELLVQIIEGGLGVPHSLKHYVLGVVEAEVLTGTGPLRCGGELSATHVTEAEARLIRRVIFGSASDRPAAVSRSEAEMLFRLKDATLHQANAPEFERLFVQGVGNYLLGYASASAHVSRERMLELEAFVADNRPQVGRFMGAMAKAAPSAFGVIFGRKTDALPSRAAQVAEAAEFTAVERDWLDAMMAANGEVDAYDRALLAFLAEETGEA